MMEVNFSPAFFFFSFVEEFLEEHGQLLKASFFSLTFLANKTRGLKFLKAVSLSLVSQRELH